MNKIYISCCTNFHCNRCFIRNLIARTVKKTTLVLLFLCGSTYLCSCATTRQETFYVSVVDDLNKQYIGKDKTYVIEHFTYPITDIKHLDGQYEILICERYRPLGKGVTRFYTKNGICYKIETNEYKAEQRLVKYSLF